MTQLDVNYENDKIKAQKYIFQNFGYDIYEVSDYSARANKNDEDDPKRDDKCDQAKLSKDPSVKSLTLNNSIEVIDPENHDK